MNRRSFLTGILAACVAPAILAPVLQDRQRWRVTRRKGLWIAEYKYMVMLPPDPVKEFEAVLEVREHSFIEIPRTEERLNWVITDEEKQFVECTYVGNPKLPGRWRFTEWKGPPSYVPSKT